MAPGVNDGQRNTGALPKSNRRNNRNRETPSVNQQSSSRSVYHGRTQHPNNLLDWQTANDRETARSAKNSNARSTASAPSISYQDFADIVSYGSARHFNYTADESSQWQEMAQPVDSRTQSPPQLQGTKPTNVDKMPDRRQVESRLYQIRDYIGVTSTMLESLSQSSDPRARTQHEKLSRMVEDLCDSETKLAKLLEDYNVRGISDESGDHQQPLRSDQMKRFVELLDVLLVTNSNRTNSESVKEDGEENGNEPLEAQLRRKMEASQRKLAELQEHQANLVGMQLQVRERLNAARQAQQALLRQENEAQSSAAPVTSSSAWETASRGSQQQQQQQPQPQPQEEIDEIDAETSMLRSKLAHLQSKKKHMDQLMVELQAVELSDRASVSSESSRNAERDKAAELQVLKAQLAHLKLLMEEATKVREATGGSTAEPDHEPGSGNAAIAEIADISEEETVAGASYNSFERQSEIDEFPGTKSLNSKERPTVEEIQAVTRELKEQSSLLQAARAELRRLKQASGLTCVNNAPANSAPLPGSTPPSSIGGFPLTEKKQSNNNNNNNNNNNANNHQGNGDIQQAQTKKRQMEELVRKEQSHSSSVNRDVTGPDWSSRRGSNSQLSHASTPANVWPHPNVVGGSNEPSVDAVSSTENLLDIGPQITAVENGFGINWWNEPVPTVNQSQNGPAGTAEYYRQLLMGSQAQQLQMMGTTMQQCCQLLWAQQRELQSMRNAIIQLQQQFRQSQTRGNDNTENREDYSNLGRTSQHPGGTLDASLLPPSSSLPNLVSLPNSTINQNPILANPSTSQQAQNQQFQAQAQQQQQQQQQNHHQQLNNQVPPGNRANNYWDNFRSYSRQNQLSGNPKTAIDVAPAGSSGNSVASTNAASGSVNSALMRDKRNREHGADNFPLQSITSAEAQYSLNLQLQSNFQSQDRETPVARSNILSNEQTSSQQQVENFWDENHSSFRPIAESNDDLYSLRHMSGEMRDILGSLVAANRRRPDYLVIILREIKAISNDHRLRPRLLRSLRALQDTQSTSNPLNEVTDQTASESCQSSDEDSDFGAQASALTASNTANQMLMSEIYVPPHSAGQTFQLGHLQLADHFEFDATMPLENAMPVSSSLTPGYNEDLAEADQSRPEASNSQQGSPEDDNNEGVENEESQGALALEISRELPNDVYPEEDGAIMENSILDRIPTRLFHH